MDHKNYSHKLLLFFFTAIAYLLSWGNGSAQNTNYPAEGENFVFTNVNVIPMDREQILENHTVIVNNGRITSVTPAGEAEIPAGAEIIEGEGKYLMPGLTEMHGHIPGENEPEYAENVLFLYLSNGVTTVRNMAGSAYHLKLRERVNNNEIPGPVIFAAGPWLSKENAPTPQAVERVVRQQKEAGFDLLKLGSISPEVYEEMARVAHEVNIPFAGHIPEGVGLENALEAGQKSIDHFDRYVEFLVPEDADTQGRDSGFFGSGLIDLVDRDRIPTAVQKTIDAGTWNVPTLSLVEHLALDESPEEMITRPEMQYMPRKVLESWKKSKEDYSQREDFQPKAATALVELRRQLLKELHDAGAPIALGSDAPQFFNVPGFSIHHEMRMMVASGLSPYEVLVTGTRMPADYFGTPEEFGKVKTGSRADLILLDANPLEDIKNVQQPSGVMFRGIWWPKETIEEGLEEIAAWAQKP